MTEWRQIKDDIKIRMGNDINLWQQRQNSISTLRQLKPETAGDAGLFHSVSMPVIFTATDNMNPAPPSPMREKMKKTARIIAPLRAAFTSLQHLIRNETPQPLPNTYIKYNTLG
ncbi:hypothetical protein HAX39_24620 [Citrobacter freundii]|nr:hypothetical protein [Citrobacter freundii]